MQLWPDLEYPLFNKEIVNKKKKTARHALIQNMWFSLKIKPEPFFYGFIDVDNNDPLGVWIEKGRADNL